MGKISNSEFQKWGQAFQVLKDELLRRGNLNSQQQKELVEIVALAKLYTERGEIVAVVTGLGTFGFYLNPDTVLGEAGITFAEWAKKVMEKIKEHCAANGY